MIDKYQKIIDEENLKLKQRLSEIDRETNKKIKAIVIIGIILIFLWCYICFY
jgi:hypothetical protein